MKFTIEEIHKKEVDLKTVKVCANVRYWEDGIINGTQDVLGENTPCKSINMWNPYIEIETGKIINWEIGKTAYIHYKVVDSGSYYLLDSEMNVVLSIENDYVPSCLSPNAQGYGDYIIMDIDANGYIKNWKFSASDIAEFMKKED